MPDLGQEIKTEEESKKFYEVNQSDINFHWNPDDKSEKNQKLGNKFIEVYEFITQEINEACKMLIDGFIEVV